MKEVTHSLSASRRHNETVFVCIFESVSFQTNSVVPTSNNYNHYQNICIYSCVTSSIHIHGVDGVVGICIGVEVGVGVSVVVVVCIRFT